MINVKRGKKEYLEKMMKIYEEIEKPNFEKYRSFILFLNMVFLKKQFS